MGKEVMHFRDPGDIRNKEKLSILRCHCHIAEPVTGKSQFLTLPC